LGSIRLQTENDIVHEANCGVILYTTDILIGFIAFKFPCLFVPSSTSAQEQGFVTLYYLVQEGDSLWGISTRLGITITELQKLNGISDPNQLMIGMHLLIPVPCPQMNVAKDSLGN
jgi:hypothetical protein